MFSKTFRVAEDEDYGEIGLMPSWISPANAGQGTLIPHDMFEHSATAKFNATEEELMAIGAAHRIRGENGFFNQHGRQVSDILSNDVYSILTDLSNSERGSFIKPPGNTYKLKDEQAEFVCQASASKGIRMAISEWRDSLSEEDEQISDSQVVMDNLTGNRSFPELQAIVAGWMRIGYMNAQRRFPEIDLYGLAYLYKGIGKSVDEVIGNSYPGDKVRVTVDLRALRFTVRNLEHRDDY